MGRCRREFAESFAGVGFYCSAGRHSWDCRTFLPYDGTDASILHGNPRKAFLVVAGGNPAAERHFEDTIQGKRNLEEVRRFLPSREIENLERIYHRSNFIVRGAVPGPMNESRWEKMALGDVVLIYDNAGIRLAGDIATKARNKELAHYFWKEDAKSPADFRINKIRRGFVTLSHGEIPVGGVGTRVLARHKGKKVRHFTTTWRGLTPAWAKDTSIGKRTLSARVNRVVDRF